MPLYVKSNLSQKVSAMLDTRGYIRLQKGNLEGAKADLEEAVKWGGDTPDGATLFHYSVALKALNRVDEATTYLKRSFDQDYYRPSHELQNLWRYLATSPQDKAGEEYRTQLFQRIESMSQQANQVQP